MNSLRLCIPLIVAALGIGCVSTRPVCEHLAELTETCGDSVYDEEIQSCQQEVDAACSTREERAINEFYDCFMDQVSDPCEATQRDWNIFIDCWETLEDEVSDDCFQTGAAVATF